MDLLDGLNKQQREAAETVEGPLLIIAGPGSGKTRVITHRIAYLVRVCGVLPYRITAMTFTNKAAREMKERLFGKSDQDPAAPLLRDYWDKQQDFTVSTFHAFCASILRREGHHIGLDRSYTIYDDEDQIDLLKRSMEEVSVDPKHFAPRAILSAISGAKSQLIDAQGFAMKRQSYFDEIVHRVYERYQDLLSQSQALDFDDLLLKTHLLFDGTPDVLQKYQSRYAYLLIDEFQDTNVAQYAIARQLAQKHGNICVVGDPDQSIYSWRNADIRNILSFQNDYPHAKVVTLEENYRSTKTILEAARHLIALNRQRVEKNLWTNNGRGKPIVISEAYNEEDEAQFVIRETEQLVERDGYPRGDIAVMYRINAQSRALEEACLRYGVPYQLVGGTKFYQRREVKDVIAYLRLIVNPHDDVSLARIINIPPRGIGQRTVDNLARWARETKGTLFSAIETLTSQPQEGEGSTAPFPSRTSRALVSFDGLIQALTKESDELEVVKLIEEVLERTGYGRHIRDGTKEGEERWENIKELQAVAAEFADMAPREGLLSFLERVALVSDVDTYDSKQGAITLITLHQAKGLEFPVVFIVGMEEGLLPHRRSLDDPQELEEERRLCYVGMTRAKERLYLVRAFRRGFMRGSNPSLPSRFLADIPPELISAPTIPKQSQGKARMGWTPAAQKERPLQAQVAFTAGDKVRHSKFGEGIVVSCVKSGQDTEVTVAFKGNQGVKRLLLSFAPLERVE